MIRSNFHCIDKRKNNDTAVAVLYSIRIAVIAELTIFWNSYAICYIAVYMPNEYEMQQPSIST